MLHGCREVIPGLANGEAQDGSSAGAAWGVRSSLADLQRTGVPWIRHVRKLGQEQFLASAGAARMMILQLCPVVMLCLLRCA